MGRACGTHWGEETFLKIFLVQRNEGNGRIGREDNIKMSLKEIGRQDTDSIILAQERDMQQAVVNTVMKFSKKLRNCQLLK